jgi:hypothetical protein
MLLTDYLQLHGLPMIPPMLRHGSQPERFSIDHIGQFILGDAYVIQMRGGNAVTIPDLQDMIGIICDELRAAPNYDVEVFAGAGRQRNALFLTPKRELGRPFGRNLRRLRENLMLWMAEYAMTGELPADVFCRRGHGTVHFERYLA